MQYYYLGALNGYVSLDSSWGWLNAMCNLETCPRISGINKLSLANIHSIKAVKLFLFFCVLGHEFQFWEHIWFNLD